MTIMDPPYGEAIDHDFGHGFNYAVWTPNTEISFHNVTWDMAYRDVVHYATDAALNVYLDAHAGPSWVNSRYAPANQPIDVDIPFNKCYKYNYIRVYNPAQPLGGTDEARYFYYFITDVQYLAPNTTRIMVQLDVW